MKKEKKKIEDNRKLAKNDSKNKAMKEYVTQVWGRINSKLPFKRNVEQRRERVKLFKKFDLDNNGYINYEETKLGIRNVLGLSPIFISNQVVECAFEATIQTVSKNCTNVNKNLKLLYLNDFRCILQ